MNDKERNEINNEAAAALRKIILTDRICLGLVTQNVSGALEFITPLSEGDSKKVLKLLIENNAKNT